MDLYRQNLLDHYTHPRNQGQLKSFTHQSAADNPLCGDSIQVWIDVKDGLIKDISFEADSCAITMASASLVTEQIKGKPIDQALQLQLEDIQEMLGSPLTTSRQQCALVVLEAIKKSQQS
jgi:nitrogen fixation NifU-like protein